MSLLGATALTAWATLALAIFAFVTAVLAGFAFLKQSREVREQATMLRIQAEQLAEDRKVNAEQIRVLKLQAEELGQLSDDRKREAQDRRRAQAAQVNMWLTEDEAPVPMQLTGEEEPEPQGFAHVLNTSQQPVYEVLIEWWPAPGLGGPSDEPEERAAALYAGQLMPGKSITSSSGDAGPYAICLFTFRDAAGVRWRRRPNGELVELA